MGAKPKGTGPGLLVSFRLDADLLARVDAQAERMQAAAPWAKVSRTDAVRWLLLEGLAGVERTPKAKR